MVNPKLMEAWFNLMTEAMKGTKEAQEVFQSLSQMSEKSGEMGQWAAKFMPAAVASQAPGQAEAFEEWLEESWRMMGVVPRSRYLELLEKYDSLQRKLEKTEATVQRLRDKLSKEGQNPDQSSEALEMWNTMLEDTLKAQTEWMQAWTSSDESSNADSQDQVDTASKEPKASAKS